MTHIVEEIMAGYNMDLYEEGNMLVTEEEFVYDSVRNSKLCQVINFGNCQSQ